MLHAFSITNVGRVVGLQCKARCGSDLPYRFSRGIIGLCCGDCLHNVRFAVIPCRLIGVSVMRLNSGTMKAFLPVTALLVIATSSIGAQDITVRRADGSERRLSTTELATLPRLDFEAADHGVMTRFEGVELRAILQLAAAGPTDSLRGPTLRRVVVLIGADGYAATIALADVDPGLGARRVYVVNRANGGPLAANQGPWRAVVVGDGRAARWVRQLQRIELIDVR